MGRSVAAEYPKDFHKPAAILPGRYRVTWTRGKKGRANGVSFSPSVTKSLIRERAREKHSPARAPAWLARTRARRGADCA